MLGLSASASRGADDDSSRLMCVYNRFIYLYEMIFSRAVLEGKRRHRKQFEGMKNLREQQLDLLDFDYWRFLSQSVLTA